MSEEDRVLRKNLTLHLWLIRHAEGLGNLDKTHRDLGLSPKGERQADALREVFEGTRFDAVFSSPLKRAVETCERTLPGVMPTLDARLTEWVAPPERTWIDPAEVSAYLAEVTARTPSLVEALPESGAAFRGRVCEWLEALPRCGRYVVFSHFAVMRVLLGALLPERPAPQQIEHAAVFEVLVSGGRAEAVHTL